MLKTALQAALNRFGLINTVTPLTLGIALLTLGGMPAEAIPVLIQSPAPTTQIYGSPIPSPVPINSVTGSPCALSPYNCRDYNIVVPAGRGVIDNSTLINPTVINSRISDSVLVNPVIINSPRFPYGTFRQPAIYNPPPGVRIRIGL